MLSRSSFFPSAFGRAVVRRFIAPSFGAGSFAAPFVQDAHRFEVGGIRFPAIVSLEKRFFSTSTERQDNYKMPATASGSEAEDKFHDERAASKAVLRMTLSYPMDAKNKERIEKLFALHCDFFGIAYSRTPFFLEDLLFLLRQSLLFPDRKDFLLRTIVDQIDRVDPNAGQAKYLYNLDVTDGLKIFFAINNFDHQTVPNNPYLLHSLNSMLVNYAIPFILMGEKLTGTALIKKIIDTLEKCRTKENSLVCLDILMRCHTFIGQYDASEEAMQRAIAFCDQQKNEISKLAIILFRITSRFIDNRCTGDKVSEACQQILQQVSLIMDDSRAQLIIRNTLHTLLFNLTNVPISRALLENASEAFQVFDKMTALAKFLENLLKFIAGRNVKNIVTEASSLIQGTLEKIRNDFSVLTVEDKMIVWEQGCKSRLVELCEELHSISPDPIIARQQRF